MKYLILFAFLFSCTKKETLKSSSNLLFDHIVLIVLENHSYNQIMGDTVHAPFINSLINDAQTALFTQSFALTHPSQPNYIMLFSGADQGIINDSIAVDTPFHTANIGAEFIQKGLSFTGYCEGLPYAGYTGVNNFLYFRIINPWVNWQGSGENSISPASNLPFSEFPSDFVKLSTFSIVIPDVLNDMHNGTVLQCDQWIKNNLGAYINWAKSNNSLFILTFDEDNDTQLNQIPTFFTGAHISGGHYNQKITHYNLLRTIEDFYQLPYAGASADSSPIKGIMK